MPLSRLSNRGRLIVLALILAAVAVSATGVSMWTLYRAAFAEERARLVELVQSQARLIEAVARFDAEFSQTDHPEGAAAATLGQVVEANKNYQGFGESGEFVLGKRDGNMIVFLLDHREYSDDHPAPHRHAPIPFDSRVGEPMRRALTGQSGTVIGPDYRGITVLAAHEPVAVLNLGLVAKIDLAEVQAPFIEAGVLSGLGAAFVILVGVLFFRRIFNPVVERLEETVSDLADAQRIARLGSWDWNVVENEQHWSDELYRILGLEPQESDASDESFLKLIHPDDRRLVQRAVDKALYGKHRLNIEHRIVLSDGNERIVQAQGEVTFDDTGKPIRMAGTVQDITEVKQTEAQLQQAQKMEAVGQLTGGVAHDFNNLLTVILGNLQLLERRVEGDARIQKRVRRASDAALRGADLTKRLLAFSRRQVLEPEVVGLDGLVAGMDDLLRRTLGEAIEIKTALADELWPATVDRHQLESALLNLAINARDAMPSGGKLTIETANSRLEDEYVARHAYVVTGDYVMLAVTDTGTGMSPEVIEHAFEPFFTTKGAGKGSGLGLSMVYGFVKQSRGHVNIYSEEGHGTTVKLYLPRAKPGDEAVAEEAAPEVVVRSEGETILVVEDDAAVREIAVALLEDRGYRVLEAGDGRTALGVLDEHPDIDLLLTDVVMPGGMGGPDLARNARERRPDLKVLYTSGYTENAIVHGGVLDEGVEMIGKPYQTEELAQKVRQVLDEQGE